MTMITIFMFESLNANNISINFLVLHDYSAILCFTSSRPSTYVCQFVIIAFFL